MPGGNVIVMAARMFSNWVALSAQAAWLTLEAQQVIALRLMKIGAGGAAAQTEMARMLTEKVAAAAETLGRLSLGGSGRKVVRRYRTRVRANARRLSRPTRRRRT
jgi:hypothetical protein